ncbi:queuosine precursor transporter [Fervidobacterium thailandense]|uniref:Probable queuosine precursor transporter n=1 Tax=Fervidobacterium thailandense TaxID=1008305 RepID=A0A1E3G1M4_9BACT|nr:queuosine precursor transporter [Fervidobacterium thailandense]ODN30169.1 hypothetical protein A4H02_07025 [Fervidobacterium thailandense]
MVSGSEKKLMVFTTLFVTGIVISNVLAAKIVKVGVFVFPASIISYTFTFILVNMLTDVLDGNYSKVLVYLGFLAQTVASLLILLGLFMPSASVDRGKAYELLLGTNWRFTLASVSAYGVSQFANFYLFSLKFFKNPLILNFFSVAVAQLLDTVVFTLVAFLGEYKGLVPMILSQYLIKVIIILVANPVFLVTKRLKER